MNNALRLRSSTAVATAVLATLTGGLLAGCNDDDEPSNLVAANACLQVASNGTPIDPITQVDPNAPEIASAYTPGKKAVYSRTVMAVAANPIATKVACDVLNRGGTATDAAVAAQMALNLVEPQSSGIGGGAFMLRYDAAAGTVTAYDGRETAPAAATPNYLRWISDANRTLPVPSARASGRSIGTPGVLRMLELAHSDSGRLPWKELFQPAIGLATDGFRISPRMSSVDRRLARLARPRSGRRGLLPECRRQRQGRRHAAEEPGAGRHLQRHRRRRRGGVLRWRHRRRRSSPRSPMRPAA